MIVETPVDGAALAARAADLVTESAEDAIAARGRFTLALSGGDTPAAFLGELASRPLPWEAIHLFQVDERVAPPGHPDRNLTGLLSTLVERVPLPAANLHAMPVDDPDLSAAAERHAAELARVTGTGALDVVHLGLGDDGHTASWPSGDPVVDATADVAVIGPYRGRLRMTLTPRAVNRAGRILWLVSGRDKAGVVARLVAGDPALPASRVRRDRATLLAGDGAGALLQGRWRPAGGGQPVPW